MISYKHEQFIAQAIEGVLMQQTAFPIELVIADDHSPDGTGEVIARYQAQYPQLIRVLPRPRNLGMMPNFADALTHCTAKYVAICEGDDYWTNPQKLHKQIEFMEAHPDYVLSFHNMFVRHDDGTETLYNPPMQATTTTIVNLAVRNYIATASCLFRRTLTELPEWFMQVPAGDYSLHMLHARHGKIGYLPDIMGVYRVHGQSNWQSKSEFFKNTNWFKTISLLLPEFEGVVAQQLRATQLATLQKILADTQATAEDKSAFLAANVVSLEHLLNYLQPQFEQQRIKVNSLEYRLGATLLKPARLLAGR